MFSEDCTSCTRDGFDANVGIRLCAQSVFCAVLVVIRASCVGIIERTRRGRGEALCYVA